MSFTKIEIDGATFQVPKGSKQEQVLTEVAAFYKIAKPLFDMESKKVEKDEPA